MEAGVPNPFLQTVTFVPEPSHPGFSDQRHCLRGDARPLQSEIVFDHAAAAGLVSADPNGLQAQFAVHAGQPREAALEFFFRFDRIERQGQRGQFRIGCGI